MMTSLQKKAPDIQALFFVSYSNDFVTNEVLST